MKTFKEYKKQNVNENSLTSAFLRNKLLLVQEPLEYSFSFFFERPFFISKRSDRIGEERWTPDHMVHNLSIILLQRIGTLCEFMIPCRNLR